MALHVRSGTDEGRTLLARVAHPRTASRCELERARLVWRASQGRRVSPSAAA